MKTMSRPKTVAGTRADDERSRRVVPRGRRRGELRRMPCLERLEDRQLLAITSTVISGVLSVTSDAADTIALTTTVAGDVQVNGANPGTGAFLSADVTGIAIRGAGSNDIDFSAFQIASFPDLTTLTVDGGGGTSEFLGPNASTDFYVTGPDAGVLGGTAFGSLSGTFQAIPNLTGGAAANDFLFSPGASLSGAIQGGSSGDTLDLSEMNGPLSVVLTGSTGQGFQGTASFITGGFSNIATMNGPLDGGTLTGENLRSTWTLNGAPTYSAYFDGTNTLAFQNFQTLQAGNGGDTFEIIGNALGQVTANLVGGSGDDTFNFQGAAQLVGSLDGGGGFDTLSYAAFDGSVSVQITGSDAGGYSGTEGQTFSGGGFQGIDNIIASPSAAGSGILTGDDLTSTWDLGATQTYSDVSATPLSFSGFDTLQAGAGANTFNVEQNTSANLNGGAGNDSFVFSDRAVLDGSIDGQGGVNTLDLGGYQHSTEVNLAAGTASVLDGTLANIQDVIGGTAANTITGDSADNTFVSNGTSVVLVGGSGNDTFVLTLPAGSSTSVTDNQGNSSLDFSRAGTGIVLNLDSTAVQTVASGRQLKIDGQFTNVIGTPFADEISTSATAYDRTISGGPADSASGDILQVDAGGRIASVTPTAVLIQGMGTISYSHFSQVNLVIPTTTVLTSSDATSVYGESVTFTATVAGTPPGTGTPTGTITFYDGPTDLGTGTLDGSGEATYSTSALSLGSHSITASYGGDANFLTSVSSAMTQTVGQATPTVSVTDGGGTYNTDPYSATDASVTGVGRDGTIASFGDPTLSYSYYRGATLLAGAPTAAGAYTVVAHYTSDNANYTNADSSAVPFTIAKADASVLVNGYSGVYDGNSHMAAGTATGVGGVDLGSDLNLTGTTHTSAGTYASDGWSFHDANGNYQDASGTVSDVINKATLTVDADSPSKVYGAALPALSYTDSGLVNGDTAAVFSGALATTATAASGVGSYPISQGTLAAGSNYSISFTAGTLTIFPAITLSPTNLPAATVGVPYSQQLTASGGSGAGYSFAATGLPAGLSLTPLGLLSGTPTTAKSLPFMVDVTVTDGAGDTGSQIYPLTVNAGVIAGNIDSSLAQSYYGEDVTLTATFSAAPAASTPMTGTVAFYDGNTYLGTEPLIATGAAALRAATLFMADASPMVSGTSSLPTSSLSMGNHIITAVYSGDANYSAASTESSVSVQVIPAVTSVTLTASTTAQGTTLTAKIVVTSPGNPPIVGTVSFHDGSTLLGTVPLSNGVAILNVSTLSAGVHSFSAVASSGGTFSTSTTSLVVSTEGPLVTGLRRYGISTQPTYLFLNFNGPLDPTSAQNPSNYQILGPGGHRIRVVSAIYDPATQTVTLVPAVQLNLQRKYSLTVNGAAPAGLTNLSGVPLDGSGKGHVGSNYVASITRKNLAGKASKLPTYYLVHKAPPRPGSTHTSPKHAKVALHAAAVDHLLVT